MASSSLRSTLSSENFCCTSASNPRRPFFFRIEPGQQLVGLPQPAHQRPHEDDRVFGTVLNRGDELVIGGDLALDIAHRGDRGGARPRLEQAHLAEDLAGIERRNPAGADFDLHPAAQQQVGGIAIFALGENALTGLEPHNSHDVLQDRQSLRAADRPEP